MKRFATIKEKEIDERVQSAKPKGTVGSEVTALNLWDQWKAEQNLRIPEFDVISEEELVPWLKRFIWEVRRKDGKEYKKGSLMTILKGLAHVVGEKSNGRIISLYLNKLFKKMLDARLKETTQKGKGITEHKKVLTHEEEHTILTSKLYNRWTPRGLRDHCMFWVLKQLCACGGSLYTMEARWLILKNDDDGRQFYTYQPEDATDKVHRGRLGNVPLNLLDQPIYDNPKNCDLCPVTNLLNYLSKHPGTSQLHNIQHLSNN